MFVLYSTCAVGLALDFSSAPNITGMVLTLMALAVLASYYQSMILKMDTSLLEDMTSKNTSYWYTLLFFLLPLPPTPFLSPSLLLHPLTLGIAWTSLIDRARVTRANAFRHDDPREHRVGEGKGYRTGISAVHTSLRLAIPGNILHFIYFVLYFIFYILYFIFYSVW